MLISPKTESIRMNPHRELYCTNAISLQAINSIYPSFNMIHVCFWSSWFWGFHFCWHVYPISLLFLRCGGTRERARKPVVWSATKEYKMCFLLIPSLIPQKRIKRNACSLLNTSNNVVTKQFILVLWIKAFLVFLVKRWGHRFVSNENKTKQKSQRD